MSRIQLKYRPEVDGLRAIAVAAVVLYHARLEFGGTDYFQGGYLGVDVFLVISGYLIALLIGRELEIRGEFGYWSFYERRVRRLMPALMLVLLATIVPAWLLMVPSQMVEFAESMLAALGFASNVYFHVSLQEYGAESSLLDPLLHCWSLSLEEQYYLLFPALFVLLLRRLRRHLLLAVLVVGAVSLAAAHWTSGSDPSLSFYLLPWRAWELLGGVLLACLELQGRRRSGSTLASVLAGVGLLAILGSIAYFDGTTRHPSLWTLIPVAGTMLVIRFAGFGDWVGRLLSNRGMVYVGLISYSLYLWHYPVFAFGRLSQVAPSRWHKLSWILISLVLAAASYRWVERPFRDRRKVDRRTLWLSVGACAALLVAFSWVALAQEGLRFRFDQLQVRYGGNEFDNAVLKERSWEPLLSRAAGEGLDLADYERDQLWFSPEAGEASPPKTRLLLVGNSHSKDLYNALVLNRELFPHLDVARYGFEIRSSKKSGQWNRFLSSPNFRASDVVVVSTRYRVGEPTDDIEDLPGFVEPMRALGKTVIVTSNTPEFASYRTVPIFDHHVRNLGAELSSLELERIFFERLDPKVLETNERVRRAAAALGVPYLDKFELTCRMEEQRCQGLTPDGFKMYYDYGHFTLEGARYLGRRIAETGWLELSDPDPADS